MMNAEFLAKHRGLFDRFINTLADVDGKPTVFLESLTDREIYIMAHFMNMFHILLPQASFELIRISKLRGIENNQTAPELL